MSLRLVLPILLFAAFDARAALYTVGLPPCTHMTFSAALAAAEASPEDDIIRLRSGSVFSNVGVLKQAPDQLTIEGGFASCTSSVATGLTRLDGSSSGRSVIRQRGGRLILRDLLLTGGAPTDGLGGGVNVSGNYTKLDLERVTINANSAVNGGGLYIDGSSASQYYSVTATALRVEGNTAKVGGGIYLRNAQMRVTGLGLRSNLAYRDGGGVLVDSGASMYVLAGATGDSAIAHNRADRDGGGAVVRSDAVLWLTNSDEKSKEMTMTANSAGRRGGGVYIENLLSETVSTFVTQGINLIANRSARGAVYSAFARSAVGAPMARVVIGINDGSWSEHQPCLPASRCDVLLKNRALADDGTLGVGAIGYQEAVGSGVINAVVAAATLNDNEGYDLFDMHAPVGEAWNLNSVELRASLVFQNRTSGPLVAADGSSETRVVASTIANNQLGASMLQPGKFLYLQDSILYEPTQTVVGAFDQLTASNVLVAYATGLPVFDGLLVDDPRFIDPAIADYHLSPYSIAIDRAPGINAEGFERDHRERAVDLPDVAGPGKQDLGCYERQPND